jgi:hypothetical protein
MQQQPPARHSCSAHPVNSYAAPVVAAACTLLVETGSDADSELLTDPVTMTTTDRLDNPIRLSATSALVKALLLAGAERVTRNTNNADISDYRSDTGNQTDNGLDYRYGAGQLNIRNSYNVLVGGEVNSLQDHNGEGTITGSGFDVDPIFGGENSSNREAHYYFTAGEDQRRLYASLVWHLSVDGGDVNNFDGTAVLHDLDLLLYDITNPDNQILVAASESQVENTENLWTPLVPGRSYRMEVVAAAEEDFNRDYALAWQMATPTDSDSDGIPDDWEVQFGLDHLNPDDASEDYDGDLLDNEAEYLAGTDNNDSDTDGDGLSDGLEVDYGTDPLDSDSYPKIVSVPAGNHLLICFGIGYLLVMVGNRTEK